MINKFTHRLDDEVTQHPDFEENHIYLIRGKHNTEFKSVTTFVKKLFPQFNATAIINSYYENWQRNPKNKYFGMTKKEIAVAWQENGRAKSMRGSKIHRMIENYYEKEYTYNVPEFHQFQAFQIENSHLSCVRTEHIIFDDQACLVGTVDALMQDTDGNYYIVDWKTNKEITRDNTFESANYPIQHIPHSNYWHYTLQLNVYKYIYEKNYGIKIKGIYLCHILPDKFELIKLGDLQKEVRDLISAN